MTLPSVGDFAYPTPEEVRDSILRTIRIGFLRRGLEANILPGSDHYIRADAIAKRVSIAIANNRIALANSNPLTATGDDLTNLCSLYGVEARPASQATGYVTIGGTNTSFSIPNEYQCTGPNGLKYRTIQTEPSVTNGSRVQIRAVVGGESTNLDEGDLVSWDSAAVGQLKSTATVAAGGIDGGADADSESVLRQRLIDRLSFPAEGGNWAQVKLWAENASAAVGLAFVYPALRGPGSYDVAVVGSSGDGVLTSATVDDIASYVSGQANGSISINVTAIANTELDVILSASLPLPAGAGGAGGGWRDTTPYPAENVQVTAYDSATGEATVDGATAPSVGNSIGIWDPDEEEMNEYSIMSVSGSGPWDITVGGGFLADPTDAYVSAGAVNLQGYAAAFLAQCQALGPGEKTANADILVRARRHPGADLSSPTDLSRRILGAVTSTYSEILDIDYALRVETGTATPRTSPAVPATTADPPYRLKLRHFAIRKS